MTIYLRTGFFLAFLAIFAGTPAFAQTSNDDVYREWVDYRDGEISVDFDQTPVQFALYAIHAETGAAAAVAKNEPAAQPLSTDERAKLQKELERWNELKQEERGRIEDRLKTLPESEEREQLVKAYGRQVLGLDK